MYYNLYKYFRNRLARSAISYIVMLIIFNMLQLLFDDKIYGFVLLYLCMFVDLVLVIFIVYKMLLLFKVNENVSVLSTYFDKDNMQFDSMIGNVKNGDTMIQIKCGSYIVVISKECFSALLSDLRGLT